MDSSFCAWESDFLKKKKETFQTQCFFTLNKRIQTSDLQTLPSAFLSKFGSAGIQEHNVPLQEHNLPQGNLFRISMFSRLNAFLENQTQSRARKNKFFLCDDPWALDCGDPNFQLYPTLYSFCLCVFCFYQLENVDKINFSNCPTSFVLQSTKINEIQNTKFLYFLIMFLF